MRLTPAQQIATAELDRLREEIQDLPHAPACPGSRGCWCPLRDVVDLIDDRARWWEEDGHDA